MCCKNCGIQNIIKNGFIKGQQGIAIKIIVINLYLLL